MARPGRKKGQGIPEKMKPYAFKPGQSGNPSGRPKMTPKQRVLKELTLKSFQTCVEAVCTGNTGDLERMINDPDISALQVGIATSLLKAMSTGDYAIVEKIVQTVTGKPPEELIVRSTNLNANLNAVVDEVKVKAAMAKLEKEV